MASRFFGSVLVLAFVAGSTSGRAQSSEGASELSTPRRRTEGQTPAGQAAQTEPSLNTPSQGVPFQGATVPAPPTSAAYGTARYAAPHIRSLASEVPLVSSSVQTRLRALDGSLTNLAARGGSLLDGVLSIVSGGLSVGLGVFVHDDDRTLASYLYLWGVTGVARGIIDVALLPRASRPSIQFGHMPMSTDEEVEARLRFGESALRDLSRRARLSRILDASLSVTAGLLVLPIYLIPNNFSLDDPFDWFVLIGSSVSVITGIINLASRSNAERRWNAYKDLRDRLEGDNSVAFSGGVTPVRGGATATLGITF